MPDTARLQTTLLGSWRVFPRALRLAQLREPCDLAGTMGFEPPSWEALASGARPASEPYEFEPGGLRQKLLPEWNDNSETKSSSNVCLAQDRAMIRSQAGPGAGTALSVVPTDFLTQIPPHLFRIVLLRRLRLPLPLSLHTCRCGRPIDSFGHHRAACARAGVFGRRGSHSKAPLLASAERRVVVLGLIA